MTRELLVEHARRTGAHARAGTAPLAADIHRVDAARYVDRDRWELEIERIFRRTPLIAGFTAEFAEPHAYKALELAGTPILLTRDGEEVRAFVNSCRHRGANVTAPGSGTARRFTCPYHAWTYDSGGRLVGILDRDDFGDLDPTCHGLVPLPCAVRAGMVFVGLDPAAPFDLDRHLCGYGEMLDHLGFARCTYVGQQSVEGPNWKVAYDGYLDFYHLPILHKDSFGTSISNRAIYDAWGPHQRVSSPDRAAARLLDRPEDEWTDEALTDGVWTVFPHASIAGFRVHPEPNPGGIGGRMFMVSTLSPTDHPGRSVTVQHFLADFEVTDELLPVIESQQEFLLRVVRDEDYFTGHRIQQALATGAVPEVLFGRNEAGGQRFHRWVDDLLAAPRHEDHVALFDSATADFQP